jgi:hypothetical protein
MEGYGMGDQPNWTANRVDVRRRGVASTLRVATILMAISWTVNLATAGPEEEVRAAFDRFVTSQNSHDIKAVESSLLGSPNFLWITRGNAVWGQDAAVRRFATLYDGTWRLDPEMSGLKIMMLSDAVAQIYVPITFAIGAPGQPAQQIKFLMNQILIKTPAGWRVSSILPIPAPAQ